jgi:hypothetical protein
LNVTPAEIIADVRPLVQDTRAPYRYTDAVLLGFVNQSLKRMAVIRPDLFTVVETVQTAEGNVIQTIPDDGIRLVDVFNVAGGGVVTEVNRGALDRFDPGWRSAPSGVPVNFVRHVRNPRMFFLYPPPQGGVDLIVEYAATPANYTLAQEIDAPVGVYRTALVDCVVFLAQSIDDEHINSQRAKLFLDSFNQTLVAGLQNRTLTDTEEGGMDPRQVI